MGATAFAELVEKAAGVSPYPYQECLADEGLPELLEVPTGAGKTLAATLPWLYRRRFHPDEAVRVTTPRWLVFTLPMRVLVEQTHDEIRGWLRALDLVDQVGLYRVMGGEGKFESRWRYEPERDAIFVGTLDMLLSRALNRGYGESRWAWPIDFGLFNNGIQWVFDEIQLMGSALPTSRQLEGLRTKLGFAMPSRSMWMSATVDHGAMRTVDCPGVERVVTLQDGDRIGGLAARLDASKRVRCLEIGEKYEVGVAEAVAEEHRPGTRTIVVLNTVDRAREVYRQLEGATDAEVVLLHSRFRLADRARQSERALEEVDESGSGLIVVATQVIEAGVDLTSTTLVTEAAPWPSIIQRAGRCNRDGKAKSAQLLWTGPPKAAPYREDDVAAAVEALYALEGELVTPPSLADQAVPVVREIHPVLRRRDLLELFDTLPDLSGNDVDIARFIRAGDDVDVQVAWRDAAPEAGDPLPGRDERCAVPVAAFRAQLKTWQKADRLGVWRFDHLSAEWLTCYPNALRPGTVLVVDRQLGCYDPVRGWDPKSRDPVEEVRAGAPDPMTQEDGAVDADPLSSTRSWLSLSDHLQDVEREVRRFVERLDGLDLPSSLVEAAAVAGRYHDIGKAHPVFQTSLENTVRAEDELPPAKEAAPPWAKSGSSGPLRHERRYFRHELASALALLGEGAVTLEGVDERDLVVYLVAAHHGRVRLGIRSLPNEWQPEDDPDRRVALGICDGESLPAVATPNGEVPQSTLRLSWMTMGESGDGEPSWAQRAVALRDRPDLGPFRLGFLEALVRLADWRASSLEGER